MSKQPLSKPADMIKKSKVKLGSKRPRPQEVAPIPFVTIEDGKCILSEPSRKFLETVTVPFGVVVVAGKYRTGKSLLINKTFLEGRPKGFPVGSTVQPCTKGLRIYPQLVYLRKRNRSKGIPVVVVDTEGLGSVYEVEKDYDLKIFTLSVVISSLMIYNTKGAINEDAISNLHLVVQMAQMLQSEPTRSADFPQFVWLLRDFSMELISKAGKAMTENDYLEEALDIEAGDSEGKRSIRQTIKAIFSKRQCFTLPPPASDPKVIQALAYARQDKIEEQFLAGIEKIREYIASHVEPKKIKERPINGTMYVKVVEAMVKGINNNQLVPIEDQWTMLQKLEKHQSLEKVMSKWKSVVDTLDCSSYIVNDRPGAVFDGWYESMAKEEREKVLVELDTCFLSERMTPEEERQRRTLTKDIDRDIDKARRRNSQHMKQLVQAVLQTLEDQIFTDRPRPDTDTGKEPDVVQDLPQMLSRLFIDGRLAVMTHVSRTMINMNQLQLLNECTKDQKSPVPEVDDVVHLEIAHRLPAIVSRWTRISLSPHIEKLKRERDETLGNLASLSRTEREKSEEERERIRTEHLMEMESRGKKLLDVEAKAADLANKLSNEEALVTSTKEELGRLKERLDTLQVESTQRNIESQNQIDTEIQKRERLNSELETALSRNKYLETKSKEDEKYFNEESIRIKDELSSDMRKKIELFGREKKKLLAEIDSVDQTISQLRQRNASLDQRTREETEKREEVEKRIDKLQEVLGQKESEVQTLKGQERQMTSLVDQLKRENKEQQTRHEQSTFKIHETWQAKNTSIQDQLHLSQKELMDFKLTSHTEYQQIKSDLSVTRSSLRQYQDRLQELKGEKENLETSLKECKEGTSRDSLELCRLRNKLTFTEEDLTRTKEISTRLTEKNRSVSEEVLRINRENHRLQLRWTTHLEYCSKQIMSDSQDSGKE